MLIRVGFSADPDDAFMFWGLASGAVSARGHEFEPAIEDIQTLNEWALEGRLEVTAMSLATLPHVADRYVLLPHGASMGTGYGPIVVARDEVDLHDVEIVIPGRLTTAYLVLRLALGAPRVRELPFDQILDEVRTGRADAGLLIHEGQLTYADAGLRKLLDLGAWWQDETGLPLPLGVNVARRDLDRLDDVSDVLGEAIRVGLENRDEALAYAERFGRGIDRETADRFVAMYVNELTTAYGERGQQAIEELFRRAGPPVECTFG